MKALIEKGFRGIKGVKVNFKYYEEFFFAIHKGVSKEEGLFELEINPVRVQPR